VEPTVVNVDELEKRLKRKDHEAVVKSLRHVNFGSVRVVGSLDGLEANGVAVDLLATFAGKATQLEEWSADAKINTDRNLRLQYLAGMWLNTYEQTQILGSILKYYRFPEDTFVGSNLNLELLRHALNENGRKEPGRRTPKP
jgi:spermidine synthase